MSEAATIPTWGYRPDGSAEIFDLQPGETLPEGWHPSPTDITDPALATAEARSATIARTAEEPGPPSAPRATLDADGKGRKISHPSQAPGQVEALRAEKAGLAAEVAELHQALDASRAAHADALAHIEVLATQLAEALASAALSESAPESSDPPGDEPPAGGALPPRTRDEDLTDREIARWVRVSPSTVAVVRKAST